jgi:hypothetical protein
MRASALRWLLPWRGVREARAAFDESATQRQQTETQVAELRRLHAENHISARVHYAMRGGRR